MPRQVPERYSTMSVSDLWSRIEAHVAARAPALVERLAPPATDTEIEALEAELGHALPEDYKASLRVHRGFSSWIFGHLKLLAPAEVLEHRDWLTRNYVRPPSAYARVDAATRRAVYDPGWVPIAMADQDRAHYPCLDLVPTSAGARGQIVSMVTNDPDRTVGWASFRALLADELLRRLDDEDVDEALLGDEGILELVPRD